MSDHLSKAVILAKKDFDFDAKSGEVTTQDEFHEMLSKFIRHLIDHDFERLLNGLYRIDVSEARVKQTFASKQDVAGEIATLIIERELQKVVTREKYKNG